MLCQQLKQTSLCVVFVDSSEEEEPIEEESEAVVYRKPTTYDNLLASLGSSNKAVADMNKRRYLYIKLLSCWVDLVLFVSVFM